MSHSQFHSINLFILRHAWLNLWDKHMTTGRINQVTTFQSAFAAIIYSRVTNTRFQRYGVHYHFPCFKIHRSSTNRDQECFYMASSNVEPTNGITSFPILTCPKWDLPFPYCCGKQRSPTYDGDYQRPMTPKRHSRRHGGSPSGWLHQVWPSASNPPPSTSLKHVTKGQPKGFKGKTPRASLLRVGFPRGRTHPLDTRQPSHPSKRHTKEASKLGSLESPLSTSDTTTPPEQATTSPWAEPISWQKATSKRHRSSKPTPKV
jgi:hypothetical protein